MQIYRLTKIGERLAHSYRSPPDNPKWNVIHFLNRRGEATKEQILVYVPSATSQTLIELTSKKIIMEETGVNV